MSDKLIRRMRGYGLPDFETLEVTAGRQTTMLRRLQRDDSHLVSEECEDQGECSNKTCSAACWFKQRDYRSWFIPKATNLIERSALPRRAVTVVHPRYRVPVNHLSDFNPSGFKQWLGRASAALSSTATVMVVGSIEFTLNVELDGSQYWSPHAQLVVAGASKQSIKDHLMPESSDLLLGEKPLVIKPIYCLGRAIGYATKRHPQQRTAYIDQSNGRQNRSKGKLLSSAQCELDGWLLSQPWNALHVMHGIRRHGSKLVVMKADSS